MRPQWRIIDLVPPLLRITDGGETETASNWPEDHSDVPSPHLKINLPGLLFPSPVPLWLQGFYPQITASVSEDHCPEGVPSGLRYEAGQVRVGHRELPAPGYTHMLKAHQEA